jgi:hypothetical protein
VRAGKWALLNLYFCFKQLNSHREERRIFLVESNLEPLVYAVGVLSVATFFEQRPVPNVADTRIVVGKGLELKYRG